jgi:predicted Zn-dependent peptidase
MDVQISRLANGITIATHHMPHLESLALGLWVGAGTRSETRAEHGISHLLEHMAFKGTARWRRSAAR